MKQKYPSLPVIFIHKGADPTILLCRALPLCTTGSYEAYRRKFWKNLIGYDANGQYWKVVSTSLKNPVSIFVRALPQIFSARVSVELEFDSCGGYLLSELKDRICAKLKTNNQLFDVGYKDSMSIVNSHIYEAASFDKLIEILEQFKIGS